MAARMLAWALLSWSVGCGARSELFGDDVSSSASEICNGADDDGDGAIDEGIAPVICGIGACRSEWPGCVDGKVPRCEPGRPTDEICDDLDNDCDGAVDEGMDFGPVAGPFTVWEQGALWLELMQVGDGMLATWNIGFDGSHPTPSVLARRLTADGLVDGTEYELLERPITMGPRASRSVGGSHVLSYCARYGSNDAAASAALTTAFVATEHGERSPTGRSCGAGEPDAIWTGTHHLFAWTDNSTGPVPGFEMLLDVFDAAGASVGARELYPEGDLSTPPRLSMSGDRAALVAGIRPEPQRSQLSFRLLDTTGTSLTQPLVFDYPSSTSSWGLLDVATGGDGAFLTLVADRFEPGLFRMRVSREGDVIEGPTRYADIDWRPEYFDLTARPSGGFVAAGAADKQGEFYRGFVMAIADDGSITHLWFTDDAIEEYLGFPSVLAWGRRVFVFYSAPTGERNNELRVREFGCTGQR